jgi:GNAT superfamily N-acetyltransferase
MPDEIDDTAARALDAFHETWVLLGRTVGPEAYVAEDGFVMTAIGPLFINNQAVITAVPDDPTKLVERILSFYDERNLPFLIQASQDATPVMRDAIAAAGLVEAGTQPFMVLEPVTSLKRTSKTALEITLVEDPADLELHLEAQSAGFSMPIEGARAFLNPAAMKLPAVRVFNGRLDGRVVATSMVVVTASGAGVYSVSTIDDHRRRGFGEAMTVAAVEAAIAERVDLAYLQASDMGLPVYERLGFTTVDTFTMWGRHAASR